MGRLKGLGSFLWITGVVFLGLRLLHLGIPLLHTGGPTGPVYLDRLESIAGHTQFVPRIPSYWPETLGARPDRIVVTRRPHAGVEIRWAAQRSIRIRERRDGPVPAHPPTAGTFPGYPGSWWWREVLRNALQWIRTPASYGSISFRLRRNLTHRRAVATASYT